MARFEYLNVNPKGVRESDCVCRAITLASGLPYEEIKEKLTMIGELYSCPSLCVGCYRHLIEDVLGFTPINAYGLYPNEFADLHSYGNYIIRVEGHIICCKDGVIYDIFDSRYFGMITDAWRVE